MKDFYAKHNTKYSWLIKEEGWVRSIQGVRESQLALGNGFLGTRAVLEEIPYDARPGTYITGLYDNIGSRVDELVNLPNPFNFRITVDGEKLGVITMDALEHRRTLNMRNGLLCRHSVFQDIRGRKYDLQSARFVSRDSKHVGVMQIVFTPLSDKADISVETGISTSVHNAGTATEGRKKHFRTKELGQFKNEGYLLVETFAKKYTVIFRSGFYYETAGKKVMASDNIFELSLRKNQTIVFTKLFYLDYIDDLMELEKLKKDSEKEFRKSLKSSFNNLLRKNTLAWERLWALAEISIWGDPEVEKNLRFNIYHLMICATANEGFSSIGARTLSGEGYRGHVFWDTEIFLLPFYIYTFPEIARSMLLYRYQRLDMARENARKAGFRGAMFPWESASSGIDETPDRAKDLNGKVIKIHTGQLEHHITADVAYAFYYYFNATRDNKFLQDYGYEVLFETARFWASRVKYDRRKKKYVINQVIGPDEFHVDVDNNAFTNIMAKWNLLISRNISQDLKKNNPGLYKKISQKLGLTVKETNEWRKIASKISIKVDKKQVIEQFDGYFRKKNAKVYNWDENYMPVISKQLASRDYSKTQLIKQADVLMALYILSDAFTFKTKSNNYHFYIDRTMHKSSLSAPMNALMAIEVGDRSRAYGLFNTTLRTDISNIYNNTYEGMHGASLGGAWQLVINGFVGLRIQRKILSIRPRLPRMWRKVLFCINWRGRFLRIEVENARVKIQMLAPRKKRKVRLKVFGLPCEIKGSKVFKFERKKSKVKFKEYYL